MTHALRITDGVTTISLVDEGVRLTNYTPAPPSAGASTVTETIAIYAHDTQKAALVAKVRSIEAMISAATARQQETVYLEIRIDGESDWWRSPLHAGRVALNDTTLREWINVKAEALIHIERAPYFEGPETALQLTANGQTARTVVRITNGAQNWIGISGNQVKGSTAAPLRLRLINRHGVNVAYRNFYLAVNAFNAPTTFLHAVGTNLAATWAAGTTHTETGGRWKVKLTQQQIESCKGDSFHVLGVFDPLSQRCYVRGHIGNYDYHDQSGPEIYSGELFGEELIDFGSFSIPSTRGSANNECNFTVTVRSTGSGFGTLKYLYLMPTETFRHWKQDSFQNADGVFVEENGPENAIYRGFANARYGGLQAFGTPLAIWPGRDQRIYVAFSEASGSFFIGRILDIQAWYRPRRLTI